MQTTSTRSVKVSFGDKCDCEVFPSGELIGECPHVRQEHERLASVEAHCEVFAKFDTFRPRSQSDSNRASRLCHDDQPNQLQVVLVVLVVLRHQKPRGGRSLNI